ncbi:hypothetical protein LguiB_021875 [Lonicera macranthoides]
MGKTTDSLCVLCAPIAETRALIVWLRLLEIFSKNFSDVCLGDAPSESWSLLLCSSPFVGSGLLFHFVTEKKKVKKKEGIFSP